MKSGTKPLLIVMTDGTCSLMSRFVSGKLDPVIQRLHASDTKIITVDLGD
jgi:hypothetical protein